MAEDLYKLTQNKVPDVTTSGPLKAGAVADVPTNFSFLQAGANIPQNFFDILRGAYGIVTNPLEVGIGVGETIAGGAQTAARKSLGQMYSPERVLEKMPVSRQEEMFRAFAAPYQSAESFKQYAQERPVEALLDISGGAGIASKVVPYKIPSVTGKVPFTDRQVTTPAVGFSELSKATNPLYLGGKVLEAGLPPVLGFTTGVGAETVKKVYEASKAGIDTAINQIVGKTQSIDVLNKAKAGLQEMIAQKNIQYSTGKKSSPFKSSDTGWAASPARLDFAPIRKTFDDVKKSITYKGQVSVGEKELAAINEVEKILNTWESQPKLHTAAGLDFLKQRIDAVYPDDIKMTQAQRVIDTTRNGVKNYLVKEVPEYQKAMSDYENAIETIREIDRGLIGGSKASQETALRKLLRTTRDETGIKLSLADKMQKATGIDLSTEIAGASMKSYEPKNLLGTLGGGAGIANVLFGGAGLTPATALGIGITSPKITGLLATAGGKLGRYANPIDLAAKTGVQLKKVQEAQSLLEPDLYLQQLDQMYQNQR
jgi:hypothetical protein